MNLISHLTIISNRVYFCVSSYKNDSLANVLMFYNENNNLNDSSYMIDFYNTKSILVKNGSNFKTINPFRTGIFEFSFGY